MSGGECSASRLQVDSVGRELELSRREPASLPPSPGSRAPASPAPAPRRAARLPHAASEDSVPHRDRDSTSSNSSQYRASASAGPARHVQYTSDIRAQVSR